MQQQRSIFTVTTMRASLASKPRCVGYFYTLEEAQKAVKENDLDIGEEGYYTFCVIEEKLPGVYNFNNLNEWWYRWSGSKRSTYFECEKPESFKRTVCFSMG
jgi:hypothetical protein